MDRPPTIERLPADFADWEGLLALIQKAFAIMDGIIEPPSSVHRLDAAGLAEKAKAELCLVATVDGTIAGCAFLADRGDHFYLGNLAVDPAHQGRGIGRVLAAVAEGIAYDQGKHAIELQTRVELTGNQAAFRSLGFTETDRTAHAGYGRPTSVTMRKELR